MKGIFITPGFNIKPPLSRYSSVWDTEVVLNYLRSLGDNASLSLKILTVLSHFLAHAPLSEHAPQLEYIGARKYIIYVHLHFQLILKTWFFGYRRMRQKTRLYGMLKLCL